MLRKGVLETECEVVSTRNQIYWPIKSSKTNNLMDFFIINKI